jgi:sugar O-acyltransferase (sialic acid O-acetyltransferase NeuD family)
MADGKEITIIGGGGHCKVVLSTILASLGDGSIQGVYDDDEHKKGTTTLGHAIRHTSEVLDVLEMFVAIGDNRARRSVVLRFQNDKWPVIIHPSAWVAPSASLGEGTVVCAGAVIQAGAVVGKHCIINTNASIDHDCSIGDFAHVAPGSTLCGHVRIGRGSLIGAGSTIKPRMSIAQWCVVGCGAVVVKCFDEEQSVIVGIPAGLRGESDI